MKVAILAGGVGSRIAEETSVRPKPMVEIGGKPILWHIMQLLRTLRLRRLHHRPRLQGRLHQALVPRLRLAPRRPDARPAHGGAVRAPRRRPRTTGPSASSTPGQNTATGGRIKRLAPHLGNGTFMLTWGDGVSDVDLDDLLDFHRSHGKLATLTAVRPPARFGHLELDGDRDRRVLGEAPDRRGLDQRGLLRAGAGGLRLHRRRRHACSSGTPWSGSPRTASSWPTGTTVLAVHGHAARQEAARAAVGLPARHRGRSGS